MELSGVPASSLVPQGPLDLLQVLSRSKRQQDSWQKQVYCILDDYNCYYNEDCSVEFYGPRRLEWTTCPCGLGYNRPDAYCAGRGWCSELVDDFGCRGITYCDVSGSLIEEKIGNYGNCSVSLLALFGIFLAFVLLILGIVLGVWYYRKRNRRFVAKATSEELRKFDTLSTPHSQLGDSMTKSDLFSMPSSTRGSDSPDYPPSIMQDFPIDHSYMSTEFSTTGTTLSELYRCNSVNSIKSLKDLRGAYRNSFNENIGSNSSYRSRRSPSVASSHMTYAQMEEYPVSKGHVYIFNYTWYENHPEKERVGADMDVKNLNKVFSNMGYKVNIINNLSYENTNKRLQEISQLNGHHGCLLVFILSQTGVTPYSFKTTDWSEIDFFKVRKSLTSQECPAFKNRPKLFFCNFCKDSVLEFKLHSDIASGLQPMYPRTSGLKDMVTIHANTKSLPNNPQGGSIFINSLCEVLTEQPDLELREMYGELEKKMAAAEDSAPVWEDYSFKKFYFMEKKKIETCV
ncbi:unnamed protein product [Meganyctiphanes norvegica]|uniref:Caspase family p20 domain-containing protein n=1 Tax=Meganyctiphanes norvegica TaxID=48144 RepID=A0AAV2QAJ5_MEGNR